MKVSDIRSIDIGQLSKTLDEHPNEVFTIPDMAKLGWLPDSDNATRLYVKRHMPSSCQVRDDAKRLRYFGCPKAIQSATKIMYPAERET